MIPMSLTKEGSSIQIERMLINDSLGKRLMEIGISKGNIIDVIKNDTTGLIISISGSRLALDKTPFIISDILTMLSDSPVNELSLTCKL
ncbi:ferrous iron transport protein A, partial [Clostridium perfringens]